MAPRKLTADDKDIDDAWLAVRRMMTMLPRLTAVATEALGRPVRVEIHPAVNHSEGGDVIYLAPPSGLAKPVEHSQCEIENKCNACKVNLVAETALRHEIGHFAVGTFGKVTRRAIESATKSYSLVADAAHEDDEKARKVCADDWERRMSELEPGESRLQALSRNRFIANIFNFIEDVRINHKVMESFPESRSVFVEFYTKVYTKKKVFAFDEDKSTDVRSDLELVILSLAGLANIGQDYQIRWLPAAVKRILIRYRGEHKKWMASSSSEESMILAYDIWRRMTLDGFIPDDHHPRAAEQIPTIASPCLPIGKPLDPKAVEKAIEESDAGYEGPSHGLTGVRWVKFGEPGWWVRSHARIYQPSPFVNAMTVECRKIFQENDRSGKVVSRSGRVDTRKLSRAGLDRSDFFYRRQLPKKRSYYVSLAADCSGSMGAGERMDLLRQALLDQATILNSLDVEFELIGHSGDTGLVLFPVKLTSDKWDAAAVHRLCNLNEYMANLDGHTLELHVSRAITSQAEKKIVIYYTDGSLPAENYKEELNVFLRTIDTARRHGVTILCVGINTVEPQRYGLTTVRYDRSANLVNVVSSLADLLKG